MLTIYSVTYSAKAGYQSQLYKLTYIRKMRHQHQLTQQLVRTCDGDV